MFFIGKLAQWQSISQPLLLERNGSIPLLSTIPFIWDKFFDILKVRDYKIIRISY